MSVHSFSRLKFAWDGNAILICWSWRQIYKMLAHAYRQAPSTLDAALKVLTLFLAVTWPHPSDLVRNVYCKRARWKSFGIQTVLVVDAGCPHRVSLCYF